MRTVPAGQVSSTAARDDPIGVTFLTRSARPLVALPGVAAAVERARDALVALHNHPANRRGWPATAAEASLRAARASAALDGAPLPRADGDGVGPGAGRCRARRRGAGPTAGRLADVPAAGTRPAARARRGGPRPRAPSWAAPAREPTVSARLALLADLVTGGTAAPAPVLVAVVHGELLALAPFGSADGVVARAAARLTAVATGLDPKGTRGAGGRAPAAAREYRDTAAGVRRRDRRRDRGVGAALLRAVGGGGARGAVDRRGPLSGGPTSMSRAAPRKAPPGCVRVPGIQACTTCRDGGLGVRRPDTQAHDDMPPAACCAWRARSSHTEPGPGRTGASLPHRPWPTRSP